MRAVALAERFRLTADDANNPALALRRRWPLGTLDKDLRRAAAEMNVLLLGT